MLIVSGFAGGGVAIGVEVGFGVRVGSIGTGVSVGMGVRVGKGVTVGFTWVWVGPSTVVKTFFGNPLVPDGIRKDMGTRIPRMINREKKFIFFMDWVYE